MLTSHPANVCSPALPPPRALTLTVTERCNLGCTYCHARRSQRTMSPETADVAVDFILAQARKEPRVSLSFYGGEPFLELALLRRILHRARDGSRSGQAIRWMTPSNGLALDGEARSLCAEFGVELAISIDGTLPSSERLLPDGTDSTPYLLGRLERLLIHGKLARMTVTPKNVRGLASNVKALARLGFERIVFQPAWELDWDGAAVEVWRREQHRLVVWLRGAKAAGARVPDLPNLAGVMTRILHGKPRRPCGAGVKLAAVTTDGTIVPCYRFVFLEDLSDYRLGHVSCGFSGHDTRRRFAAVGADELRAQDGDCSTCPARDGCTHYCPALGCLMLGDPRGVPAAVCSLLRAQVEAVKAGIGGWTRAVRSAPRPAWRATFLAAVSTLGLASCGGRVESPDPGEADSGAGGAHADDASRTNDTVDASVADSRDDVLLPVDASADDEWYDVPEPEHCSGIC